jgi:hypothetical protein
MKFSQPAFVQPEGFGTPSKAKLTGLGNGHGDWVHLPRLILARHPVDPEIPALGTAVVHTRRVFREPRPWFG